MNIEQKALEKNPFFQNVHKHMYNFEKLATADELQFFFHNFFGQSWLEILSEYHLQKSPFYITL